MTSLAVLFIVAVALGTVVDRTLRGGRSVAAVEAFGRALALGLGTLGACALAADGLGLGVSPATVGGAALTVGLVAAGLSLRAGPRDRTSSAPPPASVPAPWLRPLTVALTLVAVAGVALVVWQGWVRPTLQHDALTRWMLKAKAIHYDGTLLGDVSRSEAFGFSHQRYPPLVSYVAALPGLVSGHFDDRIASAVSAWYAVALTCVLGGWLARRAGPLAGAAGAAWYAHLPMVAFLVSPPAGAGAASAMADNPLALFALVAATSLIDRLDDDRRAGGLAEGAALFALLLLVKNEGQPFVVALTLGALVARPSRWRPTLGAALIGAATYALLWGRLAAQFPILDEHYAGQLRPDVVAEGLPRLGLVLPGVGRALVDFRVWNVTWPAALALVLLGGRRMTSPAARLLLIACLVQAGAYLLAYTITAWTSPNAAFEAAGADPVLVLLSRTVDRLLLHLAPLAIALGLLVSPPGEAPGPSLASETAP